jgi:long-chain acyl-CoA synthetase
MIFPSTISKLFLKKTSKAPHKKSIGYIENSELRFFNNNEYKDIVKKIFYSLHEFNHQPGNKVAILAHTSKEWHFTDLGILAHNGVVVPVYPTYLAHEVEYILNHSEASILFLENENQFLKLIEIQNQLSILKYIVSFKDISEESLSKLQDKFIFKTYSQFIELGSTINKSSPQLFEAFIEESSPTDPVSIIYTSGTTGEPKGALITNEAFMAMLENVYSSLKSNIGSSDRNLIFLPLSHVLGRCDSILNLIFDLESVYAESMEKVVDNLKIVRPTILIAVPRIFEKVYSKVIDKIHKENEFKQKVFEWALNASNDYYDKIARDLSPSPYEIIQKNLAFNLIFKKVYETFGGRVRFLVSGGAPLSPEIIKFLQNANLTILEGYGLTETIAPCVLNPPVRQIPGTIGLPLGDVQIKFAEDGEILIKTKAMFKSYFKNEAATLEAFKDGWFQTGDIGEITSEGYIKITDRKKDIIITSAGKNVAPQKIENLLKLQKHISNAVVVGDKRKFLTAIISLDQEVVKPLLQGLGINEHAKYEELALEPKIYELIDTEIQNVNKELASYESIKGFFIASSDFTVENGHITPSLKLKKKIILKAYAKEIDALYKKLEG